MDPISNSNRVSARELSLDQLARHPKFSESEKVAEVSRQFEALLLRQILQTAHAVSGGAASGKASTVNGIYEDMVTANLADTMTQGQTGGLGLARSLARQLGSELAAATKSASATDATANLKNP